MDQPNYISPQGYEALCARYRYLFDDERPKLVEVVSWAAGNGDRSENGDYLYGKKRLREIDWELGQLTKKIKAARVVNPAEQAPKTRVLFGATVTIADDDDNRRIVTLVGDDETDAGQGRIGWNSPLARALRGGDLGALRTVRLPSGTKEWEIIKISYPE